MSKLSKQIVENKFPDKVALIPSLSIKEICEESPYINTSPYKYQYKIGCTLQYSVICDREDLEYTKQKVTRAIIEEVFGEFRRPLIDTHRALLQRNFKEAEIAIQKILSEMFDV